MPSARSEGDDDLSPGVPLLQVADGLGDLAQRVRPVDDRCDLSGFDELGEDDQVLVVLLADERRQLLPRRSRENSRPRLTRARRYPCLSRAGMNSPRRRGPMPLSAETKTTGWRPFAVPVSVEPLRMRGRRGSRSGSIAVRVVRADVAAWTPAPPARTASLRPRPSLDRVAVHAGHPRRRHAPGVGLHR